MVIWVPGSPMDWADTIPALSFGSIAWMSNFSQTFWRTSRSRFREILSPSILRASSPTTDRGSQRPSSLRPSRTSCSPAARGGGVVGVLRGTAGSPSPRPRGCLPSSSRSPGSAGPGPSLRAPPSLLRGRLLLLDLDLLLAQLDVHVLLREPLGCHLLLPEPLLPRGPLAAQRGRG